MAKYYFLALYDYKLEIYISTSYTFCFELLSHLCPEEKADQVMVNLVAW